MVYKCVRADWSLFWSMSRQLWGDCQHPPNEIDSHYTLHCPVQWSSAMSPLLPASDQSETRKSVPWQHLTQSDWGLFSDKCDVETGNNSVQVRELDTILLSPLSSIFLMVQLRKSFLYLWSVCLGQLSICLNWVVFIFIFNIPPWG